jgi:GNAT superfamily N-acetyltransferase
MIIREAHPSDIAGMQKVRNSVVENRLSHPALIADGDYLDYLTTGGKGWVCVVHEEVVGFAIVDLLEHQVWALFVTPAFEKKGIGRKLHQYMLEWYFAQTVDSLWLGTDPETRAAHFYKKAGWKEIGLYENNEIKFEMSHQQWLSRGK